jgi:hypothetical protein
MAKKADGFLQDDGGQSRYDDALLSASWNPVIDLVRGSSERTHSPRRGRCEISDEEADAFLGRIYAAGA